MKKNREKKKGSKASLIIPVILILVIVFCAVHFFPDFFDHLRASQDYDALIHETVTLPADKEPSPTASGEGGAEKAKEREYPSRYGNYPLLQVDFEALKAQNKDFVCVLYLPVLDILYPVAHSSDNTEYLKRTFDGQYRSAGCIFMDRYSSADFEDRNTFILGHNMRDGTMFGSLKKFGADKDLCGKNPYIYIFTEEAVRVYRIFAYEQVSVGDSLYDTKTDYESDAEYDAFIKRILASSWYALPEDAVDFSQRPKILTLSTCYGNTHQKNFVVFGALEDVIKRNNPD